MSLTWKEGVTTLAAAGAVALNWAYYHNYSWPLVSSTRWMIGAMVLATAIGYYFSYVLDAERNNAAWSAVANILGAVVLIIGIFGMVFATPGYVATLMIGAVVFWAAAIIRHLAEPAGLTHHPAY